MATLRTTGCRTMTCKSCGRTWEWAGDEDETWIEKGAFWYPRLVKYLATSTEADELGGGAPFLMGSLGAVIGLPMLPVTLILGVPAALIRGGRSAKRGITNLYEDYQEFRDAKQAQQLRLEEQRRAQFEDPDK